MGGGSTPTKSLRGCEGSPTKGKKQRHRTWVTHSEDLCGGKRDAKREKPLSKKNGRGGDHVAKGGNDD